jgi:hypothetical protein
VVAAGRGGAEHVASIDVDSDARAFCQGWTDRGGSGGLPGSPRIKKPEACIPEAFLPFTSSPSPYNEMQGLDHTLLRQNIPQGGAARAEGAS